MIDAWILWCGWVLCLVAFYFLTTFLEERAAMRGTHRSPLPSWVDKAVRLFFFVIMMLPVVLLLPLPWFATTPLMVLYVPLYLDSGEKTGKRFSAGFRRMALFRFFKWYFNLKVVAAGGKLNPARQYIIGVHPHGFLPFGTMVATLSTAAGVDETVLNGVSLRALAASFCFYIPGYRDFLLAGGIVDAARYNAKKVLAEGYSLGLVPGGATEGLYARPGLNKLVLRNRRGFIKLALETGADLVPVYSFGENNCYDQLSSKLPWVKSFQAKFQRVLGLSLPLVTNLIPRRSDITVVFGKPIPVAKIEEPTAEQVQALLDTYIAKLTQLFDENAGQYIPNPADRVLEII